MNTTSTHITQTLESLQKDLFDLSARNPLVQVDVSKLWFPGHDSDFKQAQKIYEKARFFKKEYGLNTTLLITHFIQWKRANDIHFYTSPLICQSVTMSEKKREGTTYFFAPDDEILFVNPVLRKLFQDEFDIELPEIVASVEDLLKTLQNDFKELTLVSDFNPVNNWKLIEKKAVGIFNYKKSVLSSDYEKIIANPGEAIAALFGEESKAAKTVAKIDWADVLDPSQKLAIQHAVENHTVIQGPPGTGKSHTIVALIKTLLLQKKKVLFVSEKRSALDVVFQRLKKDKLDLQMAFFNPGKDEKKQFYAQLKKNWEWASDNKSQLQKNTPSSAIHNPLFSFYPARLIKTDPKTGTTIQRLLDKLIAARFNATDIHLDGSFPPYKTWQETVEKLEHFESLVKNEFSAKTLADTSFIQLNTAVFSEIKPVQKLAERISQLEKSIEKIQNLADKYQLSKNPDSFLRFAIAASILGMVNKNQLHLLQRDHKKFKAFNTLAKKYQLIQNKLKQAILVNQKWSKKPSVSEITELNDLLKQKNPPGRKKHILGILKRNSVKTHDYFADFSPSVSTVTKLQLLEEVRTEWHLQGELESLRIKLKHELNILNPDTEIDHILHVRTKLDSVSQNEYIALLEHVDSLDAIRDLSGIHSTVSHCTGLISYLFFQPHHATFEELKDRLNHLKSELERMDQFYHALILFFKIPAPVLNFVRNRKESIQQLDLLVTWKQLLEETRFDPIFKKLNGAQLFADFENQLKDMKSRAGQQNSAIQQQCADYLSAAEKLAETSASKLKPEAKIAKQKFKETKRTLIHEFTKKQQHLPVIALMDQAAETVLSLQPVWMMNPLSVAQFLPCEEAIFDYVIFDEASQIPLEDAIPAIYRAAQVVVVGDSQQMPPAQFFSSNADGKTLLDQAEYMFTNVLLNSHYRSQHPQLIAFSNKHFYDFELSALPPVSAEKPIELIPVNGTFEDNRNRAEALEIAGFYKALLQQGKTDIGIIAFSKEQQLEIEKQLHALRLPENNLLVIRNLENVQGIEKEIILISIGYAKNKEGVFRKNFGPVNRERGANRLNVLFTRAIEKMVVFTSVSSADFELSDNRGTTVLGDFLKYTEDQSPQHLQPKICSASHQLVYDFLTGNKVDFNYYSTENGISISCFVQHQTGKLLLVDPCAQPHETTDLFSVLHALKKRFQKIKIITGNEFLSDRKSVENKLLNFFKFS